MAINDNKRFYWLKLKKDFFQQHQIKVLKALPNGRLYALIYLELLAESTTHNGELRYSKMLPYDINTLASVIDEDVDNLKCAIDILIKLELVEILEDKTIFMREIDKLIGSETGQTIRKREAKLSEGKIYPQITQDIRYKSIDIRDKNINNSTNKFVKPTLEEVKTYCEERNNNVDPEKFIDFYTSKGWKVGNQPMKDWKACIRTWEKKDKREVDDLPTYKADW